MLCQAWSRVMCTQEKTQSTLDSSKSFWPSGSTRTLMQLCHEKINRTTLLSLFLTSKGTQNLCVLHICEVALCMWQVEIMFSTCEHTEIPVVPLPLQTTGFYGRWSPYLALLPRSSYKQPQAEGAGFTSPSFRDVDSHMENCNCRTLGYWQKLE